MWECMDVHLCGGGTCMHVVRLRVCVCGGCLPGSVGAIYQTVVKVLSAILSEARNQISDGFATTLPEVNPTLSLPLYTSMLPGSGLGSRDGGSGNMGYEGQIYQW